MIFLDFEVFKENWIVVFIDVLNEEMKVVVDDTKELIGYYEKNKERIFVGFNINHYDQFIFKGVMLGFDVYEVNKHIIEKREPGWSFSDLFWNISMNTYDTMTGFDGLKTLEAYMGHSIKETSVPFDIDRALTEQELKEVIEYCIYDVEQTVEVFMRRQDEFNTKLNLINEFNLPLHNISKSNAQLSAEVLDCTLQTRRDEWDYTFPDELQMGKYEHIKRWYENPVNHDYDKKQEEIIGGLATIIAWGGLHSAKENFIKEGRFVLVDYSSYYPSLMIEYNYYSRNMSTPEKFKNIYDERFRLRALGDDKGQEVLKLILNTTYGSMGYKYSKLYDKRMQNNVCITGQLLMIDLVDKLDSISGISVIQKNTDGVLLEYKTDEQLKQIDTTSKKWSERTRINYSLDHFNKIIQKDVNNYIALGDEYNVFVGGYVKDLSELDNNLPIINRSIREYFINGIVPEETIGAENKLIEYQNVVKVSSKYEKAIHNSKALPEKTIRVFASKKETDTEVLKYRRKDGKDQYAKFANTSINSFVDNGYIVDKHIPRKLDKQWYIDLAWRRINQFKGIE